MADTPRAVPVAEMTRLVAEGSATRLLPEFDLVPTHYAGRWWQVSADGEPDLYVPVSAELGATYDELHAGVTALDTLAEQREREAAGATARDAV